MEIELSGTAEKEKETIASSDGGDELEMKLERSTLYATK